MEIIKNYAKVTTNLSSLYLKKIKKDKVDIKKNGKNHAQSTKKLPLCLRKIAQINLLCFFKSGNMFIYLQFWTWSAIWWNLNSTFYQKPAKFCNSLIKQIRKITIQNDVYFSYKIQTVGLNHGFT